MFTFRDRNARRRRHSYTRAHRFETLEERLELTAAPQVVDVVVSSTAWTPEFVSYVSSTNSERGGYSIPVGGTSQGATIPWSNVNQIRIQFSDDVRVEKADLSISGKNQASYVISSFSYDPRTRFATWTLANPLPKDRILIDLDGDGIDPVANLTGDALDGEWTNNSDSYASGNGTAGGDFEFAFNMLPGDGNGSAQVTTADYVSANALVGKFTTSVGYNARYDFNGSGQITSADSQYTLTKLGNSLPTGVPVGTNNDAPTAISNKTLSVSSAAVDAVIELWEWFDDAESGANGLTYSISANSNPELFDSISINQSTGELTVNATSSASGVARVGVTATDSAGNSTSSSIDINVNHSNEGPVVIMADPEWLDLNTWLISGLVIDDGGPFQDSYVSFTGAISGRAEVYPDGTFEFTVEWDPAEYGEFHAAYTDKWGAPADQVSKNIGEA